MLCFITITLSLNLMTESNGVISSKGLIYKYSNGCMYGNTYIENVVCSLLTFIHFTLFVLYFNLHILTLYVPIILCFLLINISLFLLT